MKTLFKVFNILIIIAYSLALLMIVLALVGFGALSTAGGSGTAGFAGLGALAILIAAVPLVICAVIAFIAAKAGLIGDYEKSAKYGTIMLVIAAVSLLLAIFNKGNVGTPLIQIAFIGLYVFLAKKLA